MTRMKFGARWLLAATLLGGTLCIVGCADHATETTQTTTTQTTTTLVPVAPPPQASVTTTHTQQYTP